MVRYLTRSFFASVFVTLDFISVVKQTHTQSKANIPAPSWPSRLANKNFSDVCIPKSYLLYLEQKQSIDARNIS